MRSIAYSAGSRTSINNVLPDRSNSAICPGSIVSIGIACFVIVQLL
jgi:hypothetical protein